jgi:hypothetical protein
MRRLEMKAQLTKLAAVVAMAIGLVVGTTGATSAFTTVPWAERLVAGDAGYDGKRMIEVSADGDGTPRAGYMVGRFFVGFLPE